jgi:hypothetical protein
MPGVVSFFFLVLSISKSVGSLLKFLLSKIKFRVDVDGCEGISDDSCLAVHEANILLDLGLAHVHHFASGVQTVKALVVF